MAQIIIRPIEPADREWVKCILADSWGEARLVVHGVMYQADQLPGLIAELDTKAVGLLTYHVVSTDCEIVSLNSLVEGRGVGTALLKGAARQAVLEGCTRLWLVTTNDNLNALGFYQRRGFRICVLRPGEVDRSRQLKPSIPLMAANGIPIRDEIDLEMDPQGLVE